MTEVAEVMEAWSARPGRAVIFDFNGTLSDDEQILEEIFTDLFAAELGWNMSTEDYQAELLGHSDREIVQIAVERHGNGSPQQVDAILALRGNRYQNIVASRSPITPHACELVERLAAARVPMAIVTGAQRADVEAVLGASLVGEFIRILIAEEDVATGKPDPEGFLIGARLLGVGPQDMLVFEDSVPGVRGALAAGMECIAVTGPT
ncbi:MAG TPA: HAD family phosphatase, partial [Marmoricola sp.]|nr:HAD family phosphatase [Marmoricola sp.]